MTIHERVEAEYRKHTEELANCTSFQDLESGKADRNAHDQFIANVCKTHLRSPQILGFLFSVAPPRVVDHIKHNMLEELGLDEEGIPHPALLMKLAEAAGFSESQRTELEGLAHAELRRLASEPLLFGTIKEIGLSAFLETGSFEWEA